ncbi:Crp/Fnr family transcriptional regulator [Microvirga sp. SRT01]|uniref:Crp/Fnr family transcriptional regulator n=1 Tax=Sphingomonas longa TaxID=2778730 RepID=A0ABS2DC88_9SPHN|nr:MULTISPECIES: Crp/Fnr family transcriptional regulator [Alphaproteobacteria]MBM6577664.1 Crp/Fnr family transcriptional regulator [Sphingomonas sp. BT552]MBR7710707.1 Crp/Fnr family transcriptional regulator [Microvirga sp. SRT01]
MTEPTTLHRFEEFGRLTLAELEAVKALGDRPTRIQRHHTIRRQGDVADMIYILVEGWVAASMELPGGGRQIVKVHLPGDVLGSPSMCSDHAVETLTALTAGAISAVPLERFGALLDTHPRLAGYFLLSVQRERVALMDQLALMGRSSALAQVAALLLDLADRLLPTGTSAGDTFQLELTQAQLADVIGISQVHLNRTMIVLTDRGLIERRKKSLTIVDRSGLEAVASYTSRPLRKNLSWLPCSRYVGS